VKQHPGLDLQHPAGIFECDVAASYVCYSGRPLSEAFDNYTALAANSSGIYCTSMQYHKAVLEVLVRGTDAAFEYSSRIVVMRLGCIFDRPWIGGSATDDLLYTYQNGFGLAAENSYHAGIKAIEEILDEWDETFARRINATNCIGE
jgi:purine nucleoside permease